jgi:hypothetical protein
MYASKADCIIGLGERESLAQFNEARRPYRASSGSSGIRDAVAHKTYTTKARRRDILQAAGETSSEANQPTVSSQDTACESQKVLNRPLLEISNLVVEWLL